MKKAIYFITIIASIIIIKFSTVYAQPRLEYGEPLQTYITKNGPDIISYCTKWNTEEKLKEIYDELLNNFYSDEINYLKAIYIYPDSPDGINGAYYEASTIDSNGKYIYGDNAYIEIFNTNEYYNISQMAYVLSHEYGHHFTFYYLITSENKYYNQWNNTQYAKIRQLEKYKNIDYADSDEFTYLHEWDIAEIAAEDYVQLFGSLLAKQSVDFKDVTERIQENIVDYYYTTSYNLIPQENLNLPLAIDVDGLYNYWLNLAGYTAQQPYLPKRPIPYLKDSTVVYFGDNTRYTIAWDEVPDNNIYEYTVIMYPVGMPYFPTPIKTLKTGEKMTANIGSDVKHGEDGEIYGILEIMDGEYEIRIFIKDVRGFTFSSEILCYDFTNSISHYNETPVSLSNDIATQIYKNNTNKKDYQEIPFKELDTHRNKNNSCIENVNLVSSEQKTSINISKNIIDSAILNNYDYKKYSAMNYKYKRIPAKQINQLTKDKFSNKSVVLSNIKINIMQ